MTHVRRFPVLLSLVVIVVFCAACQERQPIRIGFVGGLSGRVADLGISGRNGATLAVEERNAAGGINGRQLELVVRDDEQNPETAKRVVGELIRENLEVVIGPMTSSMAMAMMPQINAAKTILLSPTVTTTDLQAKDDNFLRVISTTDDYSEKSARYQFDRLGHRSVAAIYDLGNRSYSEGWYNGFNRTFSRLGGRVSKTITFTSSNDVTFLQYAKELLAVKPDVVLIVANSVDAAMICQQLRKLNATIDIVISEWGSTERFIELGGNAVEGVYVAQFLNRSDPSPRYQSFRAAYKKRFSQEPGFAGLAGYDAALVTLESLAKRTGAEPLKKVILNTRTFQGVQQPVTIDQFGDADRATFITTIRNGAFHTVE